MIFENRVEAILDRISQQEGKSRETILLETMEMLELRGRYFFKISEISGRSVKDIFTELMDNLDGIISESNLVDGQFGLRQVIAEKVKQRKTVIDQLAHILAKVEIIHSKIDEHFSILDSAAIEIRKQVGGTIELKQSSNLRKLRFARGYFTSAGRIKPGISTDSSDKTVEETMEE
jgi:hypothetical protein